MNTKWLGAVEEWELPQKLPLRGIKRNELGGLIANVGNPRMNRRLWTKRSPAMKRYIRGYAARMKKYKQEGKQESCSAES